MSTQYTYFPYDNNSNYKKFDVVRGLSSTDTYYLYATQDSIGQKPNSSYIYPITALVRDDFKIRLTLNKTGSGPSFAAGSVIVVTGAAQGNFTGMVVEGGSNYVDYISNGQPLTLGTSGAVNTIYNPAWTSGFMFIPSYGSNLDTQTRKVEAKFGDGYSQRQRDGINSNSHTWKLSFENRSDREARALSNFIEDKGGVDNFQLLLPANRLVIDPYLKYVATNPQTNTQSFNINNISADFMQVFDI
jgi:phage-related protein